MVFSLQIIGQGNSPYSEIGMGSEYPSSFQSNFSMGGLATTYDSKYFLNPENPASYGKLNYTVGEAGLFFSNNQYSDSTAGGSKNIFNLGHFGFGFPVSSNIGVAVGILPFSKMRYDYSRDDLTADNVPIVRKFNGKGNVSEVFFGTGAQFKNLSIGVNGKYLFGELTKAEQLQFLTSDFNNIRTREITLVRGFTIQAGMIYEVKLGEEHQLKLGGTLNLGNDISGNTYQIINNYETREVTIDGENTTIDLHEEGTILLNTENDPTVQKISLPREFKTGISFSKTNRYYIGLDYKNAAWDAFKIGNQSQNMNRQQTLSLGGEFLPNPEAKGIENYWKSVVYRAGINYGTSSLLVNNRQLTEYGIKFGLGFPLRKMKYESEKFGSYVFTSIGYDRVDAEAAGGISEHYFKVNFSIILNDKWFIRRKFD